MLRRHFGSSRGARWIAFACAALLARGAAAASFPSQSLIIPVSSSYQDPCGAVSAYGLVYMTLRANDGFRDPKGKGNASKFLPGGVNWQPITVHWVYSGTKTSPNRCVPTNLDKVYNGATQLSSTQTDSAWNDGCDIKLTNSSGLPATLIDNTSTASTKDSVNWKTYDTVNMKDANNKFVGRDLAFPNYVAQTVSASSGVTSLYYGGGAFVISAADAPEFLALLDNTGAAYDVDGNKIDFSAFRTKGSGGPYGTGCTFVDNNDGRAVFGSSTGIGGNNNASANIHYVNIHRAQNSFTAEDKSPMNQAPTKIGLIQSVDHDFAGEDGTSVITGLDRGGLSPVALASGSFCNTSLDCVGNSITPVCDTFHHVCSVASCTTNTDCALFTTTKRCDTYRGVCAKACTSNANCSDPKGTCDTSVAGGVCANPFVGTPTGIKGSQLPFYLRSAGLDYNGAGGCPPTGYNASYGGWAAGNNLCPNGGTSGQIYDNLDIIDVANGLINTTPPAAPAYQVVWAPHWEGLPWRTSPSTTGCDLNCVTNALANLGTFMQTQDSKYTRGLLAECATIGTLEGAVNVGELNTYNNTCSPGWNNNDPKNSTRSGCYPNERFNYPNPKTQVLTCGQGSPSTTCVSPAPTANPASIGLVHANGLIGQHLDNCTDPTTSNGSACVHFPNPASPFSQIGDYRWFSYTGGVANYFPVSGGSLYQPGNFTALAYSIPNLNKAADLRSQAVADNVTYVEKSSDPKFSKIIYLAGHNYTADVSGTRIALNTMLALGLAVFTKESAFVGPTIYQTKAIVPTYDRFTSQQGIPAAWQIFDPAAGAQWRFPFQTGHLRIHVLSALTASAGTNAYDDSSTVSASLPAPESRNLFTYLGGRLVTDDAALPASYTSAAGNGAAQMGWKPVAVDSSSIGTGCLDAYKIGAVTKGSRTYPGMLLGTNTVCDLEEALALSIKTTDLCADCLADSTKCPCDNGASAAEQLAIKTKLKSTSETDAAKWLLQRVRGYCFSTVSSHPPTSLPPTTCDVTDATNGATLGALVRSQAAVIPYSALIPDAPTGKHRPTVIYIGGLDGQLHAFYLASDGSDSGYTGPSSSLSFLNPDVNCAHAVGTITGCTNSFSTSYAGGFSPPTTGSELWSFIPPGQLSLLKSNNARVDASPAVADVFGDFNGSGVRSWHTVLVASAGDANREIFALDVTNPLAPALLWDIQSSYDSTALAYAPVALLDDDTGMFTSTTSAGVTTTTGSARAQAFNWQNRCRAADASAGTCRAATYVLPPTADNCDSSTPPICGRNISGLYNYAHLGASQSVSVGTLRRNNAPVFSAFVATNEPGGSGIYVFAIDLVNGAKLWEWNNPYDRASYQTSDPDKYAGTGNTAPAGVSIVSRSLDDQINSLYVGDDEGSLWELDAADGVNNTGYTVGMGSACASPPCNYPLSQAYGDGTHSAQPISTLSTLFVVRPDISTTGLFSKYIGQVLLTYGTAGTDAAASIGTPSSPSTVTTVSGAIHLLPVSPALRDSAQDLKTESGNTKKTHATTFGVAYELGASKSNSSAVAFFPQYLSGGNRVYGSVVADLVTGKLYFGTTTGTVTDINNRGALSGNLYQIDTSVNSSATGGGLSTIQSGTGGIAGTLGMSYDATTGQVTLIASTDQNIFVKTPTTGGLAASATKQVYKLDGTDSGAQGLLGWIFRRTGREY